MQLREDALKLWLPEKFSERVVLLIEFGSGSLDSGWREIRCEAYNGAWKSLKKWDGVAVEPMSDISGSSAGLKRKREGSRNRRIAETSDTSNARVNNANDKKNYILIAGTKFTTLPLYLGREPVKSEKRLASDTGSSNQVELRHGTWLTLKKYLGQEILDETVFDKFRRNHWVETLCAQHDSRGQCLQVKLVAHGRTASSSKFLWNVEELQSCPWVS